MTNCRSFTRASGFSGNYGREITTGAFAVAGRPAGGSQNLRVRWAAEEKKEWKKDSHGAKMAP
jgi:hypothetical protein